MMSSIAIAAIATGVPGRARCAMARHASVRARLMQLPVRPGPAAIREAPSHSLRACADTVEQTMTSSTLQVPGERNENSKRP
jgi:hypothetical protein